jgi:hypothetical protein
MQKDRLAKRAKKRSLPLSGYLSRLIEKDDENTAEEKDDCPCYSMEELMHAAE